MQREMGTKNKRSGRGAKFYVNGTTGSDTLDSGRGESAAKPFKTIQAAINYITDNYNVSRYTATIILAEGTYEENVRLYSYTSGGGHISIFGPNFTDGNPKAVILGSLSSNSDAGTWYFGRIKIQNKPNTNSTGTLGYYGISVASGVFLTIEGCVIDISEPGPANTWKAAMNTYNGGTIQIHSNSTDKGLVVNSGTATDVDYILVAANGSQIILDSDMEINSNIKNGGNVLEVYENSIFRVYTRSGFSKPVISGTVTGKRYDAYLNGIINTRGGGTEYIPGTIAGTTATGGQYN